MPIQNWQRIDKKHSHCGRCSDAFRNVELHDGICAKCIPIEAEKNRKIVSRAEDKAVSKAVKASTQFLSSMRDQGKDGKAMPHVFNAFWNEIGGKDEFGARMAREFKKAHGEGLSADELETWTPSQKVKLQWFELISRHAAKTDESMSLDIGSLEDSDLEIILADVAKRAVLDDPDLRRVVITRVVEEDNKLRAEIFKEIVRHSPELVTELLAEHGIPTVEGTATRLKNEAPNARCNKEVEEEEYDPSRDEYQA